MPSGRLSDDDEVDLLIDGWSSILPGVDLTPLDILSRLRRVARRLDEVRRRSFARAGLTIWEFDVLAVMRRYGRARDLSPADLIALTRSTSGTMTNRIDRLTERGLIRRRPNPEDGRSVLLTLTDAGAERVDLAMTELAQREAELIRFLSPADAAAMVRLLRTLSESLRGDRS